MIINKSQTTLTDERALISVFDAEGKLGEQCDLIAAMIKIRLAKEANECLENVTVTSLKQTKERPRTQLVGDDSQEL